MSLVRFNSKRIAISYVLWAAFFWGFVVSIGSIMGKL